ncbi:MAG: hypothetical protein AB7G40_12020 [Hyphomonadaceae bacterium]
MAIYHVCYDLRRPGQNYQPVWDLLGGIGVKATESAYLIDTPSTAVQVRDALMRIVDANDRILVTELSGSSWASQNLLPGALQWLKARRP